MQENHGHVARAEHEGRQLDLLRHLENRLGDLGPDGLVGHAAREGPLLGVGARGWGRHLCLVVGSGARGERQHADRRRHETPGRPHVDKGSGDGHLTRWPPMQRHG
ncbi:MAG: hypothetical protein ACR2JD_00805 [Nocardioides sp.]